VENSVVIIEVVSDKVFFFFLNFVFCILPGGFPICVYSRRASSLYFAEQCFYGPILFSKFTWTPTGTVLAATGLIAYLHPGWTRSSSLRIAFDLCFVPGASVSSLVRLPFWPVDGRSPSSICLGSSFTEWRSICFRPWLPGCIS